MKYKNITAVIVTHVYASGPPFHLEEYLKARISYLIFIGHPFSYSHDTRSFLRIYSKGSLIIEKKFITWRGPDILFYIKDTFLTLYWIFKYSRNTDYFIGVDNLNFFAGLLAGKIIKIKRYIFYTIDYVPQRFSNSMLNSIYHFLDKLAVKKSDFVWNLSAQMVTEREKKGISSDYRKKQIVVPVGTEKVAHKPLDAFEKNTIAFIGHLRLGQGVETLLEGFSLIIKQIPSAKLVIIGGGPLEKKLKEKARNLNISNKVIFTGFVKDFSKAAFFLNRAAIAVAPYEDNNKNYTRFTDPGKPKDYLSYDLPVIITKVPQVAHEIHKRKCGIAIEDSKAELAKAALKLLKDKKMLLLFRKNARAMARDYRWNSIFAKALLKSGVM